MRITGSNRLAMPERRWAELPARRLAFRLSLFVIMVLMLVGSGIVSLRAHAAPIAAAPAEATLEGRLFLYRDGMRIGSITRLALVTCYPFDMRPTGSPLHHVVFADTETRTTALSGPR